MMLTMCFDVSLVRPFMVLFLHEGIDGHELMMMSRLGR
jgi:hypothetical protein